MDPLDTAASMLANITGWFEPEMATSPMSVDSDTQVKGHTVRKTGRFPPPAMWYSPTAFISFQCASNAFYCVFCCGMVENMVCHVLQIEEVESFRVMADLSAYKFGAGAPYCCLHREPHEHTPRDASPENYHEERERSPESRLEQAEMDDYGNGPYRVELYTDNFERVESPILTHSAGTLQTYARLIMPSILHPLACRLLRTCKALQASDSEFSLCSWFPWCLFRYIIR